MTPEIEKDGSRLFNRVKDEVYATNFKRLLKLRKKHPTYRDDQLLMYLLCISKVK